MSACMVGAAQRLLDLCVNHARERIKLGKSMGELISIQNMLADRATEIYAGRQMLYHVAWLRDQNKKISKEASMVKLFCSEMSCRVDHDAVQTFGGIGYMKDFPVERYYRDLRLYTTYESTNEIQRMLIAGELMKG